MKRLAILAFSAGWFWSAGPAKAEDPPDTPGTPPSTAFVAPTTPQVPAPAGPEGEVAPGSTVAVVPTENPLPKPSAFSRLFGSKYYEPYDPYARSSALWVPSQFKVGVKPVGAEQPAPVAPPFTPSSPVSLNGVVAGSGGYAGNGCGTGGCATTACSMGCGKGGVRHCWDRFTTWLCFRQTPNKLGLHPVPYSAPLYTYFPCTSVCGPGCGPGGCAAPAVAPVPGPVVAPAPVAAPVPTPAPAPKPAPSQSMTRIGGLPPRGTTAAGRDMGEITGSPYTSPEVVGASSTSTQYRP